MPSIFAVDFMKFAYVLESGSKFAYKIDFNRVLSAGQHCMVNTYKSAAKKKLIVVLNVCIVHLKCQTLTITTKKAMLLYRLRFLIEVEFCFFLGFNTHFTFHDTMNKMEPLLGRGCAAHTFHMVQLSSMAY